MRSNVKKAGRVKIKPTLDQTYVAPSPWRDYPSPGHDASNAAMHWKH